MRVLLATHLFPPEHTAGTELYTAELASRLAGRGHQVTVFTTHKDVGREDLSVREYSHRGARVVELTNNLYLEDFRETWDRPAVTARFEALLDELAPDVLHAQHLLYLSVGCLEAARRRGVSVLFTLHDFWLECPRMGQLVHPEGTICQRVDFARCGTCLPSFSWRQSDLARATGRALAGVHAYTGIDLAPLARGALRAARGWRDSTEWSPPAGAEAQRFEDLARDRTEELRRRVLASVQRFLAPSRFLRERFVAWGIPAERIAHLPTGVDRKTFAPRERERSDRLRVTFLGTLVPLKGAHVLLEAWGRLAPEVRGRGELALFGPDDHAPEYVAALGERAAAVGARLGGPLARGSVAATLARTDLLVVPSLWYENRPLVVLEALAARVPLVVSDLGGMGELVAPGVSGWRVAPGDAGALARRLGEFCLDRGALDALTFAGVDEHLPTWEAFTDGVLGHYDAVRGEL